MSEMIAGGACQAIQREPKEARDGQQPALHVVEQRLLVLLALDVGLVGRAQVLPRARERERLLAVEVMGAGWQPQRVATVGRSRRPGAR